MMSTVESDGTHTISRRQLEPNKEEIVEPGEQERIDREPSPEVLIRQLQGRFRYNNPAESLLIRLTSIHHSRCLNAPIVHEIRAPFPASVSWPEGKSSMRIDLDTSAI